VDELLSLAHSYIAENGLTEIAIPNVEASFSQEVSFTYIKYANYL